MGGATSYPFARWPRLSRLDVEMGRRLRHALPAASRARVEEALAVLLGADVRCEVHAPRAGTGRRPPPGTFGLTFAVDPDEAPLWLEVEPAIGRSMVDRLLGGRGEAVPPHLCGPLGATERGVLAYLIARVLADVGGGRLLLCEDTPMPEAMGSEAGWSAARASVTVRIADQVGRAALWMRPDALPRVTADAPPTHGLGALASLEVELVLDLGRGRLPANDLRACRRGDVFVPDELWDADPRQSPLRVRGHLLGASRTHWWLHAEGADLRLLRIARSLAPPTNHGEIMTDTTQATLELAGDTPIELAVEIARVRLPLEELVRLQVGEVLTTGQVIGETVTLRAGERAVAVGELVEVDGVVGVRLLRTLT